MSTMEGRLKRLEEAAMKVSHGRSDVSLMSDAELERTIREGCGLPVDAELSDDFLADLIARG